jgi:lipopolysaccharide export system permease protein
MPSTVSRYIFREAAQTWLVVTVVLLLILVTNQFAQVLGDAAANRLPKEAVLLVMGLTSVQYLTILIPVGLFLAILLALARLYRDSEMYALMACGIGPAQIYRPLFMLAAVLAALVGWLALVVAPQAIGDVQRIGREARQRADLRLMEPGRFVTFGEADAVVFAESVTPDGHLHNVFVQRRAEGPAVEVIVAAEAWQAEGSDPDIRILTFANGRRYEGEPGSPRFRIMEFGEHGIPYRLPAAGAEAQEPESQPLSALMATADPAAMAELQWRLSVPLTLLVLTLLAVPLGRASPRQGRYTGLGAGVLIYISYVNLLGAARVWVQREQIPAILGLWWVHAGFILAALVLLSRKFGPKGWLFHPPRRVVQ